MTGCLAKAPVATIAKIDEINTCIKNEKSRHLFLLFKNIGPFVGKVLKF